jgi:hypothetical protein
LLADFDGGNMIRIIITFSLIALLGWVTVLMER